jgi:hypothetical protein
MPGARSVRTAPRFAILAARSSADLAESFLSEARSSRDFTRSTCAAAYTIPPIPAGVAESADVSSLKTDGKGEGEKTQGDPIVIFAKVDVRFPSHYRVIDVRPEHVRIPSAIRSESDRTPSDCAQADARWRVARAAAFLWIRTDEGIDERVARGLLRRVERDGRPGVVIVNYAKCNQMRAAIERRLESDGSRKDSVRIPRSESESETETETESDPRSPEAR